MTSSAPNLILERRPPGLEALRRSLERDGWRLHEGWDLPADPWDVQCLRLVCLGEVACRDDAVAAVAAAARGARVIALAPADRRLAGRLLDDLRRLGPVEYRNRADGPLSDLDPELHDVLALLAEGQSLDEVAERLNYSRRTVARRLAKARAALGVRTTAEAIVRFRHDAAPGSSHFRQKLE